MIIFVQDKDGEVKFLALVSYHTLFVIVSRSAHSAVKCLNFYKSCLLSKRIQLTIVLISIKSQLRDLKQWCCVGGRHYTIICLYKLR